MVTLLTNGVLLAHTGDVPNMFILFLNKMPHLGYHFTSFEIAIALSRLFSTQPIRPTSVETYRKTCSPFLVNQDLKNPEQNLTLACNSQDQLWLVFYPFVARTSH